MKRGEVAEAVAREIDARGGKVLADPWGTGLAVADRLGLADKASPAQGGSWLFVRRIDHIPPEVASRFSGVIVAGRVLRGDKVRLANEGFSWYASVVASGTRVAVFDWMLPADRWDEKLSAAITAARVAGAEAYCLNVEPRPKSYKGGARWEDRPNEAAHFAQAAKEICDRKGMGLWFSSWATLKKRTSFPVRPFVQAADVCIPQPYRVHGDPDDSYEQDVIDEWRGYGAREVWLGRGAHELDKSDSDAWRTPEEIAAHRATTPAGVPEVWWPPAGPIPGAVVDAMVAKRPE